MANTLQTISERNKEIKIKSNLFAFPKQDTQLRIPTSGGDFCKPEPVFVDLFMSPEIDFQPGGPVRQPYLLYRLAPGYLG